MSHVARTNESCHTYEIVMSHIWITHVAHMNEPCVMYIWMSHVAHMNESCRKFESVLLHIDGSGCTYKLAMPHIWMRRTCETIMLHIWMSDWFTCEAIMLHIWMSLTCESCCTYEWAIMLHIWMSLTCESVTSHTWMSAVAHMNESCRTHEWVTLHTWMSHVAHMNESCRTHEWAISQKRRVALPDL